VFQVPTSSAEKSSLHRSPSSFPFTTSSIYLSIYLSGPLRKKVVPMYKKLPNNHLNTKKECLYVSATEFTPSNPLDPAAEIVEGEICFKNS
jgi:hypothetical protein